MNYKLLKTFIDQMSDEELMKPVKIVQQQEHNIFYYSVTAVRYSWLIDSELEKYGNDQLLIKMDSYPEYENIKI